MSSQRELYLITDDAQLTAGVRSALVEKSFAIRLSDTLSAGLHYIFEFPPLVILIDETTLTDNEQTQLQLFKKDSLFSHIPILLIVSEIWENREEDWRRYLVEDYITAPLHPVELRRRVMLAINRLHSRKDPHPLTSMPGHTSVLRAIQEVPDLKKEVVIGYVDLDNFKDFNQRYGFCRGDEALRLTGRLLSGIISEYEDPDKFVGHTSGDDFVFIVDRRHAEKVCRQIIAGFDAISPSFYDDEDRLNGFICIADRSDRLRYVPLLSLSIAAVEPLAAGLRHCGEISRCAGETLQHIKGLPGSNYLFDRRRKAQPEPASA